MLPNPTPFICANLGPNDILVLEKDTGIVHRILDGKMLSEPLLDVSVANVAERRLLGIAIAKNENTGTESGNICIRTLARVTQMGVCVIGAGGPCNGNM
jgi:hypothetical protein